MTPSRVIVVGAGVVGLSCAVRLAEAGYEVAVLARDLPLETTSAVAAALWYPYRAAPQDQVTRWAASTYTELARLAAAEPAAGVRMRTGVELLRGPVGDPWWRNAVPKLARLGPTDTPAGYAGGWRLTAPVADMAQYLPWLVARLEAAGGTVTRQWLSGLPDSGVVVHCAGLAGRALAGDRGLYPVRGQVVLVDQVGIEEWLLDQSDPSRLTYVVPRAVTVVVGGTATADDWDLTPDAGTARAILERAVALEPRLGRAAVRGSRVGLRPARATVRLETERRGGGGVVHCYGHGGAGVTLSWGCADDVLTEVAGLAA